MNVVINGLIFLGVFLLFIACLGGFNESRRASRDKDMWILRCMIGLDRTAADCEVYYRVLKDYKSNAPVGD